MIDILKFRSDVSSVIDELKGAKDTDIIVEYGQTFLSMLNNSPYVQRESGRASAPIPVPLLPLNIPHRTSFSTSSTPRSPTSPKRSPSPAKRSKQLNTAYNKTPEKWYKEVSDFIINPSELTISTAPFFTGNGTQLYLGFYNATKVAIKRYENAACMVKEASVLIFLKDKPHIADILGITKTEIVLRYYEKGNVNAYLKKHQVTREQKINWLLQVVDALDVLHNGMPGVIHGDLKSHNLLLDEHLNIYLCDFGGGETLRWSSPEILRGDDPLPPSDVYSFGIVIWEFFTNCEKPPYSNVKFDFEVERMILSGVIPELNDDQMTPLMKKCMLGNRISLDKIKGYLQILI